MSFNIQNFVPGRGVYNSQGQKIAPSIHLYGSTTDVLSDILVDGYFDYLVDYRNVDLNVNDLILAKGKTLSGSANSGQLDFIQVTQITPTIKTTINIDTPGTVNAWNANTNTPTLVSSVGTEGEIYVVSVAGNTVLDGNTNWLPGEFAIFTAGVWQKYSQSIPTLLAWNATTNTPTLVSSIGTEGQVYVVSVSGNTTLDGVSNWIKGQFVIFSGGVWVKCLELDATGILYVDANGNIISNPAVLKFDSVAGQISMIGQNVKIIGTAVGSGPTISSDPGVPEAFFYPKKAAFRAGLVSGAQWDDANIGNYSLGIGQNVTASGPNSIAMGDGSTVASAQSSVAIGSGSSASGTSAVSLGFHNSSTGNFSLTLGASNDATAANSIAIGNSNTSNSTNSIAIGQSCFASAANAISIGLSCISAATNSVAIGRSVNINSSATNSIAFNNSGSAFNITLPGVIAFKSTNGVGIGTDSPNSALHTVGTQSSNISTVTASIDSTTLKNYSIFFDGASTAIDFTLLDSDKVAGREYLLKDISGQAAAFNITITPQSGLIDGQPNALINVGYGFMRVKTDGTNWFVI
jgi:hypothetical protein